MRLTNLLSTPLLLLCSLEPIGRSTKMRQRRVPVAKIVYPAPLWIVLGRGAAGLLWVMTLAGGCFLAGMKYSAEVSGLSSSKADVITTPQAAQGIARDQPLGWTETSVEGLSIQALTVTKLPAGRLAYEFTLANNGRRFIGDLEISVSGSYPYRSDILNFPATIENASGTAQPQFNVRNLLTTGGHILLPDNFKPRAVFFKFRERTLIRASKTVWISSDTPTP